MGIVRAQWGSFYAVIVLVACRSESYTTAIAYSDEDEDGSGGARSSLVGTAGKTTKASLSATDPSGGASQSASRSDGTGSKVARGGTGTESTGDGEQTGGTGSANTTLPLGLGGATSEGGTANTSATEPLGGTRNEGGATTMATAAGGANASGAFYGKGSAYDKGGANNTLGAAISSTTAAHATGGKANTGGAATTAATGGAKPATGGAPTGGAATGGMVGQGGQPATGGSPANSCTVDVVQATHDCRPPITVVSLSGGQGLLKIDLTGPRQLELKLEVENPSGYVLDVGDSVSCNGGGGDSGTSFDDAEVDVVNREATTDPAQFPLNLFASDRSGGGRIATFPSFFAATGKTTRTLVIADRTVIADNSTTWTRDDLFRINPPRGTGSEDNPDGIVYLGLNRVVNESPGDRVGQGVRTVRLTLR